MKTGGTHKKFFTGGYVAGDTFLHRRKPEGKIITALLLLIGAGLGGGVTLVVIAVLSMLGARVAKVPFKDIFHVLRRMIWFFLAIAIFPVLFTPGFYVDLPSWFPINISREGVSLGLESALRLTNIVLLSLLLTRTTSPDDWQSGLKRLMGPMSKRFPSISDMLAVAVLAIKFLPMIFLETEEHFQHLRKNKVQGERGYRKIGSVLHSVLQFTADILSNTDRWATRRDIGGPG